MSLGVHRLLLIALMVCLPVQGWAAARMAVTMAISEATQATNAALGEAGVESNHHQPAQQGGGHDHSTVVHADHDAKHGLAHDCCVGTEGSAGLHAHSHSDHANHGGQDAHSAHEAHESHNGHCGDTCHCCITAAPPAALPALNGALPQGEWGTSVAPHWHTVPTTTPDKPPKA